MFEVYKVKRTPAGWIVALVVKERRFDPHLLRRKTVTSYEEWAGPFPSRNEAQAKCQELEAKAATRMEAWQDRAATRNGPLFPKESS